MFNLIPAARTGFLGNPLQLCNMIYVGQYQSLRRGLSET